MHSKHVMIVGLLLALVACGTTDAELQSEGRSQAYIDGFHDGSHSGMEEEGNNFEQYVRDEQRYASEADYRAGWDAGEAEGKKNQDTANAIGEGIAAGAGAASSHEADKDVTHDARQVIKHTDTSDMKALEN